MKSPVIITGFPRSGTTLVRAIVGAHPEIRLVNESEILHAALRCGRYAGMLILPEEREALLRDLATFPLTRRHLDGLPAAVLEDFRREPEALDLRAVYERLLPRAAEPAAWGEKSLGALSWVERILELYPDAFILAVVRDPRSTVRSKLVKDLAVEAGRTTTDAESEPLNPLLEWSKCARLAASWQDAAEIVATLERRLEPDRFSVWKFEEVLRSAEAFASGACASIGVEPDAAMLDPAARADDAVFDGRGAFAHERVGGAIDRSRAAPWSDLHPVLQSIIQRIAAEGMREFGYEPVRVRVSPFDRVRFGARLLRSRGRRRRARAEDRVNRYPGWEFRLS